MPDSLTLVGNAPDDDPQDQQVVALLKQLTELASTALEHAHTALLTSQALVSVSGDEEESLLNATPLTTAAQERERAFRFVGCAAQIMKAVRELTKTTGLPAPE